MPVFMDQATLEEHLSDYAAIRARWKAFESSFLEKIARSTMTEEETLMDIETPFKVSSVSCNAMIGSDVLDQLPECESASCFML